MSDLSVKKVEGPALVVRGNDIDTDRIIPARYLVEITFSHLGEYPFIDERRDAEGNWTDHPFNAPGAKAAKLLFVNANFGCGSSREHAPQCLKRWGIDAVVGVSFGEIFAGNCEMLGMPAMTVSPADAERLQAAAEDDPARVFTADLESMTISSGNVRVPVSLPENRRNALVGGYWDSTAVLVGNRDKVDDVAARLPYTRGYR